MLGVQAPARQVAWLDRAKGPGPDVEHDLGVLDAGFGELREQRARPPAIDATTLSRVDQRVVHRVDRTDGIIVATCQLLDGLVQLVHPVSELVAGRCLRLFRSLARRAAGQCRDRKA